MKLLAVADSRGAASGSGSQTRRLGYENITVTIESHRLSEALKPFRAARAKALRETAKWRKVAAAYAYGSNAEIRMAGQWHLERADGLEVTVAERLLECGGKIAQFMSPDGEVIEVATKCGQRLCRRCGKSRAAQLVQRIKIGAQQYEAVEAQLRDIARQSYKSAIKDYAEHTGESAAALSELEAARAERRPDTSRPARAAIRERIGRAGRRKAAADKAARKAWAAAVCAKERMKHRKMELVTFTLRHSTESATLQAQILRAAWPLFRARVQKRLPKALTMAKFEEPAFTEDSRRSHVHWHAMVWLPPVCWSWLHTSWSGAVNSARRKLGLRALGCAGNIDISEKRTDSDKIAAYCSKAYHYVTKQAQEIEEFDTAEGAEYLDYSYQKRWFTCTPGYFAKLTTDYEFIGFRNWTDTERPASPPAIPLRAVPSTGPPPQ